MNNESMQTVIRRHSLETILQAMRAAVNYCKGQKQLKKALHPKSTLARPPIYDRAYPEKLWTASEGNPLGVAKPILILLFVQPDKMSSIVDKSLKETYFLTVFGNKSMRKVQSKSKLESKPTNLHIA